MRDAEIVNRPRYYFALSRLIASQLGWNADRTERSWMEANVVGSLEHLVWYAFGAHVLLGGLTTWLQIALLIPVGFCVWLSWLVVLYLNSVAIGLLRWLRLLGNLTNTRVQSVLLGILTTALACHLVVYESFMAFIGFVWVAAVSLNLLAAAVLVVRDALNPE